MNIRKKVITIKFDSGFLELVDSRSKAKFMSRSDFIKLAIVEKIERDNNVNCLTSGSQSVTIP